MKKQWYVNRFDADTGELLDSYYKSSKLDAVTLKKSLVKHKRVYNGKPVVYHCIAYKLVD